MNGMDKKRFKTALLFAALVIVIYAAITHVSSIAGFISAAVTVLSPLLSGVFMALILGTPMRKIEQLFELINR